MFRQYISIIVVVVVPIEPLGCSHRQGSMVLDIVIICNKKKQLYTPTLINLGTTPSRCWAVTLAGWSIQHLTQQQQRHATYSSLELPSALLCSWCLVCVYAPTSRLAKRKLCYFLRLVFAKCFIYCGWPYPWVSVQGKYSGSMQSPSRGHDIRLGWGLQAPGGVFTFYAFISLWEDMRVPLAMFLNLHLTYYMNSWYTFSLALEYQNDKWFTVNSFMCKTDPHG